MLVWHGIYFSRPYTTNSTRSTEVQNKHYTSTENMVGRASRPMQMSHVEEQLVGELLAAGGGADHGRGLVCLSPPSTSPPAARVVVLHFLSFVLRMDGDGYSATRLEAWSYRLVSPTFR